jgi:hypothetical protein
MLDQLGTRDQGGITNVRVPHRLNTTVCILEQGFDRGHPTTRLRLVVLIEQQLEPLDMQPATFDVVLKKPFSARPPLP